jgi:hypothetical protein
MRPQSRLLPSIVATIVTIVSLTDPLGSNFWSTDHRAGLGRPRNPTVQKQSSNNNMESVGLLVLASCHSPASARAAAPLAVFLAVLQLLISRISALTRVS